MAQGHILDANTVALYGFDAVTPSARVTILDYGPNGYHATAPSAAVASHTRPIGPNQELGRYFGGAQRHNAAGSAAAVAALNGDHTLECFCYIATLSGSKDILSYSTSGESLASNYLTTWAINSGGRQTTFWEYGSGTNGGVTQGTGTAMVINTWYHVAMVISGTTVWFYLDGILTETKATGTRSTGGTSASWQVGSQENDTNEFNGGIVHLKVTARAKTALEIADAAALLPTFELPTDDALIHWKMTDPGDTRFDSSPNQIHAWPANTDQIYDLMPPLIEDGGHSAYFNGSYLLTHGVDSANAVQAASMELLRQAFLNVFTFECWFKLAAPAALAENRGLFVFGNTSTDSLATNMVGVYITATHQITYGHEYGVGVNAGGVTSYVLPDPHARYHIGVRRTATSGGTQDADIFINGVHVESITGMLPYEGGTVNALWIGTLNASGTRWLGTIDNMRFSDVARSDDEILESYERGLSLAEISVPLRYRMRGHDVSLGHTVFWSATEVDTDYSEYLGPGPVTDVVLHKRIG